MFLDVTVQMILSTVLIKCRSVRHAVCETTTADTVSQVFAGLVRIVGPLTKVLTEFQLHSLSLSHGMEVESIASLEWM